MQFVQEHLTRHHILHAPHRWFFALLLSPFHLAELHYKRKYHLNFRHAKKLFFFDMCLLAFMVFLFGATLFWYFYDPTVKDLVSLKVEQTSERLKTGERISYVVSYINRSDRTLNAPTLSFEFPKGFLFESISPSSQKAFNSENSSLSLLPLAPGANGSFTLTGNLFGSPDQDYDTIVRLSYIQEDEKTPEFVIARLITSPRDSPIGAHLEISDHILSEGSIPFQITLFNSNKEDLNVRLPLPLQANTRWTNVSSTQGSLENNTWTISRLPPLVTSSLTGTFVSTLGNEIDRFTLETRPILVINNEEFPQKKITKTISVLDPQVTGSALFETTVSKPGESIPLQIQIKNENNFDLSDITLQIPLSSQINKTRLQNENPGIIRGNNFILNKNNTAALSNLKAGESRSLKISIPLANSDSGQNPLLILEPELQAHIPLIPSALYTKKIRSNELKIASTLSIAAELRYYTKEGDQLGRGPLPPEVGKESKYWSLITIHNTKNTVRDIQFSATLAPGFEWGEKSSVSFGKDVSFDSKTRKISWTAPSLAPQSSVGIYFAVSFTPDTLQIGKTPVALQSIQVTGIDTVTDLSLSASTKNIDTSLSSDSLAKTRGVQVVE